MGSEQSAVNALTFVTAGLILAATVAAWLYSRRRERESTATPAPEAPPRVETEIAPPPVEPGLEAALAAVERREHYYVALRHQALNRSRVELGLTKPYEATKPWGVLMEITYDEASVTVFALSDGDASIYLSTGGGFIGGAGHEAVRHAAVAMVRVAGTLVSLLSPTETFPLPDRGRTIFYLRTEAGVLTGSATEKELVQRRHALAPLFFAGQDVITQYRLVSEKT
jgi:hypothetical protein